MRVSASDGALFYTSTPQPPTVAHGQGGHMAASHQRNGGHRANVVAELLQARARRDVPDLRMTQAGKAT
jgi:hypothetical protein